MSDSQPTLPSPSEGKSNAFSKDSKGHDESKDVQIEAEDVTETAPTSPKTDNDDTDPNSRSSKYRGVCREKKRWRAQISWQGHRFFLGGFQVEDKAALGEFGLELSSLSTLNPHTYLGLQHMTLHTFTFISTMSLTALTSLLASRSCGQGWN